MAEDIPIQTLDPEKMQAAKERELALLREQPTAAELFELITCLKDLY
jgi:hypothetical protein